VTVRSAAASHSSLRSRLALSWLACLGALSFVACGPGRDGGGKGGDTGSAGAGAAGTTGSGGATGAGGANGLGGATATAGAPGGAGMTGAAGASGRGGTTGAAGVAGSGTGGALGGGGGSGGGSGGRGGATTGRGGASGGVAGATTGAGGGGAGGAVTCPSTFKNPVIWEDLADNEVIRVEDTYYFTASTMHFSPGAPILRSRDLVNWDYIGHSVPVLDYGNSYNLTGGRAYINGIWASSLRYRKSNNTFYWIGCMHGSGGGYVYTAPAIEGPWTKHSSQGCYYDVGLLIDDDDKMYVASGNTTISVAQLSSDGLSQVSSQTVFTSPSSVGALEGSRFNKINGSYYIFTTQYANGEYVLRSTSGPFGPYTLQKFAVKLSSPIASDPSGSPHQGSVVQTQNGDWYYMAFIDAYPGGRIPVLAPVTWSADGWPSVTLVNNGWGASYPFPNLPCSPAKPRTGIDSFSTTALGPEWEWNHNPDNTKWSAGAGLTLQTATVTNDLYAARNTLTHRIVGPTSTATIVLDYSAMKDGDVAGLSMFRQSSAWIGIKRTAGASKVAMVDGLTMDGSWNTTATGTEVASASVSGGKIWLRVAADITPGANRQAKFSYSLDGSQFTPLGNGLTLNDTWNFFMGYRYAIFNYATQSLGGSINVASFQVTAPN
jgi:beta-xylosidase